MPISYHVPVLSMNNGCTKTIFFFYLISLLWVLSFGQLFYFFIFLLIENRKTICPPEHTILHNSNIWLFGHLLWLSTLQLRSLCIFFFVGLLVGMYVHSEILPTQPFQLSLGSYLSIRQSSIRVYFVCCFCFVFFISFDSIQKWKPFAIFCRDGWLSSWQVIQPPLSTISCFANDAVFVFFLSFLFFFLYLFSFTDTHTHTHFTQTSLRNPFGHTDDRDRPHDHATEHKDLWLWRIDSRPRPPLTVIKLLLDFFVSLDVQPCPPHLISRPFCKQTHLLAKRQPIKHILLSEEWILV